MTGWGMALKKPKEPRLGGSLCISRYHLLRAALWPCPNIPGKQEHHESFLSHYPNGTHGTHGKQGSSSAFWTKT